MPRATPVDGPSLTELEDHCLRCIRALPESQRERLADELTFWADRGLPDWPVEVPDEERVVALFRVLDASQRHHAMLTLAAGLLDGTTMADAGSVARVGSATPAIDAALRRTMPALPGSYFGDDGFKQAMRDHMVPTLLQRAFGDVLGSSDRDATTVEMWADAFDECAQRLGPSFMAPAFGGESVPYTTKEAIEDFLADWCDALQSDLISRKSVE